MELGFSSRVMAQGVTAVMFEVPMPQFTATLRVLRVPPDVTAPETICVLMMLYCLTINLSVHVAFVCCCNLYAHIG